MPKKRMATFATPGQEHIMKDAEKSEYNTTILSLPLTQGMKEAGTW